ncbi:MAG: peptide-methionine (S)-S-oxide reductase MsrA [Actinobacteria bacterium]|uniref:peptide-methionine (S)-S-oxide reductase n=1 Tax=freshwater metagenome TaxID=449393 RepID=A0A6J6NE67_9ZZZZ|nr:peptide-methionine (S)-S-oxide reductase MsrA [Actinomycetota bacterium]
MNSFVLGGGCFWCLDSTYMQFKGVSDVEVGYMGGAVANPSYEQVCDGNTGHVEVAKVIFDEAIVPAEVILDMFFTLHDPTQLNRQGNDVGTQYRSAMFYENDEQRVMFQAARDRAIDLWGPSIVTEILPVETFWMGEEYHQDFFAKNPNQGYCNAVVAPKMAKVRAKFTEYLR